MAAPGSLGDIMFLSLFAWKHREKFRRRHVSDARRAAAILRRRNLLPAFRLHGGRRLITNLAEKGFEEALRHVD